MKRRGIIIGGFIMLGIIAIGLKCNRDLNKLDDLFHSEHSLHDSSFVQIDEQVSPNEEYIFYVYHFDHGGLGYSRVFWSVVRNNPGATDLEKGLLPDGYKAIEWSDNDVLIIESWEPYYFKNEDVLLNSGDILNGVKLKLKEKKTMPNTR